jgi:hypothetical protein
LGAYILKFSSIQVRLAFPIRIKPYGIRMIFSFAINLGYYKSQQKFLARKDFMSEVEGNTA